MNRHLLHIIFIVAIFISASCDKRVSQQNTNTSDNSEQLIEANRILVKKDQQTIKGFVKRQNWNMEVTETGLWYEILKEGTGKKIIDEQLVSLKYKLTLLDGTECYNSEQDGIKTFKVGHGEAESGLHQGLLLLKGGSKARFILAPHLAHGLTGDGICIPARAIIIYEIELIPTKQ